MNILVTNDDGILAPGLALLADVCREVGTVTVVAPDREQSGTSHSLTLHHPLRPARRPDGAWQVDGTPDRLRDARHPGADAGAPGLRLLRRESRPQHGRGRALLGHGRRGDGGGDAGRPRHRHLVRRRDQPETMATYRDAAGRRWSTGSPACPLPRADTCSTSTCRAVPAVGGEGASRSPSSAAAYFSESLTRMKDPWGREIFWIGGGTITWTGDENSDHLAVAEGYISVTPLHMDLTNYALLETVQGMVAGGIGDGDSYGGYRARLVETLRQQGHSRPRGAARDRSGAAPPVRARERAPPRLRGRRPADRRRPDDLAAVRAGALSRADRPHRPRAGARGRRRARAIRRRCSRMLADDGLQRRAHPGAGPERPRRARARRASATPPCWSGDGTLGWRPFAPYDAILVAAASPEIPPPLRRAAGAGRPAWSSPSATGDAQVAHAGPARSGDRAASQHPWRRALRSARSASSASTTH